MKMRTVRVSGIGLLIWLCCLAGTGRLFAAKVERSGLWASVYTIEDAKLKFSVDDHARIVWLENKTDTKGNIIDHPDVGIFKMVGKRGSNWEDVIFPEKQRYHIVKDGNRLQITISEVVSKDAVSKVSLQFGISLENGQLKFEAVIDNREPNYMVTDFEYPRIGVIKSLGNGKPDLLWPNQAGERNVHIGDQLSAMPASRQAPNAKYLTYPGYASMQWMALVDADQCLYFTGRDSLFNAGALKVDGSSEDKGAIALSFDRFAFVKSGERWQNPGTMLMLYTGSWHAGADEYRQWAAAWRKDVTAPKWVRDMMGYFLVINKQQYGDELWDYDELPHLYELAKQNGCDVLGLFGWYDSGHDNMYPDLKVSESMGGETVLKQNIKKVKAAGGHVTMYFQGHLMDINSEFYKREGYKLESKSIWGQPYYERYDKFNESTFLEHFTFKTFSTVCPSCPEWQDLMVEKAGYVHGFAPNGVLYDQIGGMSPNPCFDESHPHMLGRPSLSYSQGRLQLLAKIQKETKAIDPEYAFFTEHITDVYSQFVDCLHGLSDTPGAENSRNAMEDGATAVTVNYPELFRYCFPNKIITIRNAFPYITPRFANYAMALGLRFEMELRYLKDREYILGNENVAWREYAAKVTALRKKHWDILGYGKFVDEIGINNMNRNIVAKSYVRDQRMAVVLWNDSGRDEPISLQVAGYELTAVSTVDQELTKLPQTLKAQTAIVALYKKQG